MKIAIVGTGISGMGAAYLLHESHDITVYEREARLGGHSNTVTVDYDGTPIPVDTGFIVYNELNYPNLTSLFERLQVPVERSNMSFSVSLKGGAFEWCSDRLASIFAQKRNVVNLPFLLMLKDIFRFNKLAPEDLRAGIIGNLSLGDYLAERGFSRGFRDRYLVPMGAAIWSTPSEEMLDFPAASFITFFENHRLLSTKRPAWRTVCGGSQNYVARLTAPFRHRIRPATPVTRVTRGGDGVIVEDANGGCERFDQVVMACHSDEALALLSDPSTEESAVLGALRYGPNKAYLHRDPRLMPHRQKVWASWNYMAHGMDEQKVSVSYWMNRLQSIDPAKPLFVTLNPPEAPREELTFAEMDYAHPLYDGAALEAQRRIGGLQGVNRTWFCGAYCGYGFHEDGLAAGLEVAERLGGLVRPWQAGRRAMLANLPEAAE